MQCFQATKVCYHQIHYPKFPWVKFSVIQILANTKKRFLWNYKRLLLLIRALKVTDHFSCLNYSYWVFHGYSFQNFNSYFRVKKFETHMIDALFSGSFNYKVAIFEPPRGKTNNVVSEQV